MNIPSNSYFIASTHKSTVPTAFITAILAITSCGITNASAGDGANNTQSQMMADTLPSQITLYQFDATDVINKRLAEAFNPVKLSTDNLSDTAKETNVAQWKADTDKLTQAQIIKIQGLLDWTHHGVGAVDGKWGKNTIKAMNAFQKQQGLATTNTMNQDTWKKLLEVASSYKVDANPVLVNYTITADDVNQNFTSLPSGAKAKSKLESLGYETLIESLAEKFHMHEDLLKKLNTNFKEGAVITVFNPGMPNTKKINKIVADASTQTAYAYDSSGQMVASYPTTVGSSQTPSPNGTFELKTRILHPNYTYSADNSDAQYILEPGPNNPVGQVWLGLSKDSYGLHGSPDPERISRQASSGCVRLTNWDALALYGTVADDLVVEIKGS